LERTSYLVHWSDPKVASKRCSCLLCSSQGATYPAVPAVTTRISGRISRTRPARRWGVREQLPQNGREDGDRRRTCRQEGPNPCDCRSLRRQSTSAPTGVSRTRIERMSIIEWRSTP